jgi:hypothetical protein
LADEAAELERQAKLAHEEAERARLVEEEKQKELDRLAEEHA